MAHVRWTERAAADLADIDAYISRDSSQGARLLIATILEAADGLGDYPEIGRVVAELAIEGYRERIVRGYRVIYRIERDAVFVEAVLHGRRLLDPADLK